MGRGAKQVTEAERMSKMMTIAELLRNLHLLETAINREKVFIGNVEFNIPETLVTDIKERRTQIQNEIKKLLKELEI